MIEVDNISKFFGKKAAVKNLSFTVDKGENLVLLGTSGCGKTTTLKLLNRLLEVSGGTVSIDQINIKKQQPEMLRRSIGYVLQRNSLFPHFTVAQNIAVVPKLLKWDKARIKQRTEMLMEKLHLPKEFLDAYPAQLSGGEAQRVNLARALVADPEILLMDEPFSALDSITRKAIRNEFVQLEEFRSKTIIIVTHDVTEAFELADRICLMDNGEIVQWGTPKELLFNPANDFVRNFLSDAYMQLLFTVTTLDDIWEQLTDEPGDTDTGIEINSSNSIAMALYIVKDKNNDCPISITHTTSGEIKHIRWNSLLSAFNNYKPG